jgi:hypothetical protein
MLLGPSPIERSLPARPPSSSGPVQPTPAGPGGLESALSIGVAEALHE